MSENSVTQLYQKLDFFKISHSFGLGKSFLFYLFGCIGTISFLISIIILTYFDDSLNNDKINQIFNTINDWDRNTQYNIIQNQYKAILEYSNKPNTSQEFQFKLIQNQPQQNILSKAFGILYQNEQGQIIIPSIYHQAIINPKKRLSSKISEGDEFCIFLNSKTLENTQWVPVKTDLQSCPKNGVSINKKFHKKLSTAEMILQGVCQNNNDCLIQCKTNGGTIDDGFCFAEYFTQEVCMVVQQNQSDVKLIDGCYGGQFEKLQLRKQKSINLTIRNKGDPYLIAIKQSGNGSCPYIIDQQPQVALARQLFIMGAFCFFICGFLVFIFNYLKMRQQDINELQEVQTPSILRENIQIQKIIRVLPLNY